MYKHNEHNISLVNIHLYFVTVLDISGVVYFLNYKNQSLWYVCVSDLFIFIDGEHLVCIKNNVYFHCFPSPYLT